MGGKFILRIEDTDRERSTQAAVQVILDGMEWLGLGSDSPPVHQSDRIPRYHEAAEILEKSGHAYRCYCSKERLEKLRTQQMENKEKPRYDGHCRDLKAPPAANAPYCVRFRNPDHGAVVVNDHVRGAVAFANSELDDLVLLRQDLHPTYNFSVVIDDHDMHITHVIRGDDHLNNTPRQINLYKAFGWQIPEFAHIPMILGPDGKKLSKRHGAVSVLQYREEGYLPDAVLNYLARLGWSHGDQEIFSREDLIALFDIKDINNAAAAINVEKLQWLNQHYIKETPSEQLAALLVPHLEKLEVDISKGPDLAAVVDAQKERAKTLVEMAEKSAFFYKVMPLDTKAVEKNVTTDVIPALRAVLQKFSDLKEWNREPLHQIIIQTAEEFGVKLGKVAQPIRIAVTGTTISPPMDVTLELLGREQTISRLKKLINA
jgi:glutamyl-tRNA synthetase